MCSQHLDARRLAKHARAPPGGPQGRQGGVELVVVETAEGLIVVQLVQLHLQGVLLGRQPNILASSFVVRQKVVVAPLTRRPGPFGAACVLDLLFGRLPGHERSPREKGRERPNRQSETNNQHVATKTTGAGQDM